jgi:hypothetical protein
MMKRHDDGLNAKLLSPHAIMDCRDKPGNDQKI